MGRRKTDAIQHRALWLLVGLVAALAFLAAAFGCYTLSALAARERLDTAEAQVAEAYLEALRARSKTQARGLEL